MNRKIKIKRNKRKQNVSVKFIIIIAIILVALMSTAYSVWTTNLNINGNVILEYVEQKLPATPVMQSSSRYTTNTALTSKFWWRTTTAFSVYQDTYEENTVTTELSKEEDTVASTITPTFTITLKNNSNYTFTEGTITTTEDDSYGYITPSSQSLSSKTVSSGGTTKLTCAVKLQSNTEIPTGSYIQYNICFKVNEIKEYFHYKILMV